MSGDIASQDGEPAGGPIQCQTNATHRILVVEDEPDIRRFNAQVLIHSGFKVDTAKDGHAGWKAVSRAPGSYALLITDHNMPGLTGLALVKKLRDVRMTLPVIMATATLPEEDLFVRYPWLQPAVALLKPYSVEQLLGTVRKFLRATEDACEPVTLPPNGRTQPSECDLQL